MKERILRAVAVPEVSLLLPGRDVLFGLEGDGWGIRLRAAAGALAPEDVPSGSGPAFSLHAPDEVWAALLSASPAPGEQSVVHLVRTGRIVLSGDADAYARHLTLVRTLLDAARAGGLGDASPEARPFRPARPLRARGEYRRVSSALGTADVHVERCGRGTPVLALATAGSDTTQWHGLMTETDITDRYELVTVDLPWHGRSSPAFGVPIGGWTLAPASYTDFLAAAADAIGLDRPLLLGASMAGAAVVHAVASRPDRFGGAVSCQAGVRVQGRSVPQLRAPDVDQSTFVPEWTYGLMNPASPPEFRKRVWWGYSSGGSGLYAADIDSYQQWDLDEVADLLTAASPHIAVLSGRYDTTVPPEASRALAAAIPNASFREMPELGHFPHAEDPAAFARHLEPALERVRDADPVRRRR
ncbi:alpha/beta fold hydrolase [Microbacterium resistens]